VPDENVLGGVNRGHAVLMSGLDYERAGAGRRPVGIMQACWTWSCPMSASASSSASRSASSS
jgi:alkylation response protein AidB-like acyl-CoA dehydrogenase